VQARLFLLSLHHFKRSFLQCTNMPNLNVDW
jgi:hypothetical protein